MVAKMIYKTDLFVFLFQPLHARLPAKFRKSTYMGKHIFSAIAIQYGQQKRLSFILISNPLKQSQKVINEKVMGNCVFSL
jgi:hypothetical protein